MNSSRIFDAIMTENLLDAKNCLFGSLYSKAKNALEQRTQDITDETFNEGCVGCDEEGDKEAYQKFFQSALKKFGVTEPDKLEGDKKKEFYNYIDKNWKSDKEKETGQEDPKTEGTETDIAKEKENIAKSQERIKDLNNRQKRQNRAERGTGGGTR
tara:strand:- start:47 stop:514 length:468 start_codon:yes stop_codon:yes gene_type:complete